MADTFTVAVRVPMEFGSAAEMAGWLERGVAGYMKRCKYVGTPYVLFRDEKGRLCGFMDGEGLTYLDDQDDVLAYEEPTNELPAL